MSFFQLLLLALIQGATEWLPVSSSGHLIFVPRVLGFPDQGPLVDAMAHLGTLAALVVYFRRDIARMALGARDIVFGRMLDGARQRLTDDARLLLFIAVATPPGLFFGIVYALTDFSEVIRTPIVIIVTLTGFGAALWAADHFGRRERRLDGLTWRDAILIGLAQALAFIPGTSRSGVTMTMARGLGFERDEAARFGMLVGTPLFLAGGAYATLQIITEGAFAIAADGTLIPIALSDALTVLVFSFLSGIAAIWFLMKIVVRTGFLPFVLYRFAIAAFLAWFFRGELGAMACELMAGVGLGCAA